MPERTRIGEDTNVEGSRKEPVVGGQHVVPFERTGGVLSGDRLFINHASEFLNENVLFSEINPMFGQQSQGEMVVHEDFHESLRNTHRWTREEKGKFVVQEGSQAQTGLLLGYPDLGRSESSEMDQHEGVGYEEWSPGLSSKKRKVSWNGRIIRNEVGEITGFQAGSGKGFKGQVQEESGECWDLGMAMAIHDIEENEEFCDFVSSQIQMYENAVHPNLEKDGVDFGCDIQKEMEGIEVEGGYDPVDNQVLETSGSAANFLKERSGKQLRNFSSLQIRELESSLADRRAP